MGRNMVKIQVLSPLYVGSMAQDSVLQDGMVAAELSIYVEDIYWSKVRETPPEPTPKFSYYVSSRHTDLVWKISEETYDALELHTTPYYLTPRTPPL